MSHEAVDLGSAGVIPPDQKKLRAAVARSEESMQLDEVYPVPAHCRRNPLHSQSTTVRPKTGIGLPA
jgi:hypothetical protein